QIVTQGENDIRVVIPVLQLAARERDLDVRKAAAATLTHLALDPALTDAIHRRELEFLLDKTRMWQDAETARTPFQLEYEALLKRLSAASVPAPVQPVVPATP